jgi:hypothetical protein
MSVPGIERGWRVWFAEAVRLLRNWMVVKIKVS